MNTSTFAADVRARNVRVRRCAAGFLLLCIAATTQAADYTIGGSISNLVGNGLVLGLDTQASCVASGNVSSVTNSPAAGGIEQCQITATEQCCSSSSSNFMSTTNGDGTINCTAVCGIAVGIPHVDGALQAAFAQTVSPAAQATSYAFGTPVSSVSDYTVSVVTQPNNPAQVCVLANASGTLAGANVTNADVTCTTVTHTVTATAGPNGSASPPSQPVDDGSTTVVTLTPDPGFTAGASGCGGSLGNDGVTYTTGAVTSDCTVTAVFTAIPPSPTTTTLSLSPNPALVNASVTASVSVSSNALPPTAAGITGNPKVAAAIAAVPTGTVAVSGGGQSCNATLSNGSGTCTLAYAAPGAYTITAMYPGDSQNLPSQATAPLSVRAPALITPAPILNGFALVLLIVAVLTLAVLTLAWRRRSMN